jgi:phosphate transport system ATP-binding protein
VTPDGHDEPENPSASGSAEPQVPSASAPAKPGNSPASGPAGPESPSAGEPDGGNGYPHTARFPAAGPWSGPEAGPAAQSTPAPWPAHGPAPQSTPAPWPAYGPRHSASAPWPANGPAPASGPDPANGPAPTNGPAPANGGLGTAIVAGFSRPEPPMPPASSLVGLEARDVAAWFGSHKVLEGVSLRMEAGKVTALIGPSGCGKSTFLRILNRMHELVRTAALAGEVLLGEDDIYDPKRRPADIRRQIGMVFQKPNPFPAMSIYDNVASGLKLAGVKTSNKDALVESSLRRAGLWNEVHRRLRSPGGALSGGQQQRLCIARSLAVSPAVLLMDEPCSALDPTSTRRIEETIRELVDQVTIVIVTHNMQQAQRVSENCAFFLATDSTPGYIVESGPTERVFEDPADPRTADYVHGRFG